MSGIHESRRGQDLAATITVTALAVVFIFLRFFSRGKKGAGLGLDDYAILVSLLSIAYECFHSITVGLVKITILLMYSRMFPTRGFRLATIVLGTITASWVIAMICVNIFQCSPIGKAWDPSLSGTCIDLKASFIGNGVPNIVTNIAILSLPTRSVWSLQTTTTHRLSVIGIFVFGCFVVFTSVYRFASLMEFQYGDTAWTLSKACTWGMVECASGIIAACMPTLRPLTAMISPKFTRPESPQMIKTTELQAPENEKSSGMAFRPPDELINKPRVHLEVTQLEDESGDEVPLNTIMVRRSMTWQETNSG
ncbi:hypothetical protein N7478_011231 [Penicillium angulare]|uniref:uncharacterized protein n=1 Tax=Penicillium angulare TaxID=116970 RepID=UPI002540D233|nr:uncharacterized protein N7478_011231 [Penicillium angulare]KAJ5263626.1 hypothetical protein N7478_011231 [Penicillium angulare]